MTTQDRNWLQGDPRFERIRAAVAPTPEPAPELELPTALPPLIVPPHRDWKKITDKLTAPVWNCLMELKPEDEEQTQSRSALLVAASNFAQDLKTLLSAVHASKIERLTGEQECAAEACRQQLSAVNAAKLALDDYQKTIRAVKANLGRANAELYRWDEFEPSLDDFPTAEQVAIWKRGKALREQAVAAAETAQGEAFAEDRRLRSVVMKELENLAPLTKRELELRNELSGDEFFDAEFGLKRAPEL